MRFIIFSLVVGVVFANNYETLRDKCDKNKDKHLSSTEFQCLFMQFDTNYDDSVSEMEMEHGWKANGLDYTYRVPAFFLETDKKNGDYAITADDMNYLMKVWDVDENDSISDKELHDGWYAYFYDRFHN